MMVVIESDYVITCLR